MPNLILLLISVEESIDDAYGKETRKEKWKLLQVFMYSYISALHSPQNNKLEVMEKITPKLGQCREKRLW